MTFFFSVVPRDSLIQPVFPEDAPGQALGDAEGKPAQETRAGHQAPGAAVKDRHGLSGLKHDSLALSPSGGQKFSVKVWAGLVPSGGAKGEAGPGLPSFGQLPALSLACGPSPPTSALVFATPHPPAPVSVCGISLSLYLQGHGSMNFEPILNLR